MATVYPTSFLLLTGLSILFSFCDACLSAFNFSDFIMFINAPIAGLTFVYHITILIIAYRHSVRRDVTPSLFVVSRWCNIIVVVLLLGLWSISLSLAVEIVTSSRHSTIRASNGWNTGLQAALIVLGGLQVITLSLTIWTAVAGRMKFKADMELRSDAKLYGYFTPKSKPRKPSGRTHNDVITPSEGHPMPSSAQEKLASLPRLAIPPAVHPVPSVNAISTTAAPRAKFKHSTLPGWHFVTPEVRPSPVTATTAPSNQSWL